MTNRFEPDGSGTPIRPIGSLDGLRPDTDDHDVDEEDERLDELPEFERDDDRTIGGGVMDEAGTAIDRGTGTIGGAGQPADETGFGAGDTRDDRSLDEATDDAMGREDRDR